MRDYDPSTGRYLQADPLGLVDGASVYGYAGQSPMMNMDPTGECFGPAIIICGELIFSGLMLYAYLVWDYCQDHPIVFNGPFWPDWFNNEADGDDPDGKPDGSWSGDKGAKEWGRRHGDGARDGREKFHKIKQATGGSRGDDDYRVNPDTGDVYDQNGENVGNLNDED